MRTPDWETEDGRVRLWCGDCLELLPQIEPGSVDAVVTDPPYGMNWNTDSTRFSGGGSPGIAREKIIGDTEPFNPLPILAIGKPTVMWGFNHMAQRLPVGRTLIWLKQNPAAYGAFLSDAELGWASGGNGVWAFYRPRSISTAVTEGLGRVAHPSQKPVSLMEWCLGFVANSETVFDPYMGSGTTGVAAVRLGRRFMGIELDPKHFATAVKRIKAELESCPMFEPKVKIKQGEMFQ